MADIENVDSPSQSTYGPQSASIDKLNIITASGQEVDVKKLLVEFSYYEDIYSFVVSGFVILRDALGLVEKLQLTGKEYMRITFGQVSGSDSNNEKTYRLYTIPTRSPTGSMDQEYIKLYFCSEELFLSEQTKVTQSYKGKKIDYIILDILANKLKINTQNIAGNVQATQGVYDFNINAMKPFEAISWVSNYALPSGGVGADMLFYENIKGFNFRSLRTLYKQTPYNTYSYQQKNLDQTPQQKATTVIDYEFMRTFNSLDDANSGTFSNRLISLNPLNRTVKVTDFDYDKYLQQAGSMNGSSALAKSTNRLGKTQNQTPEGKLKLQFSNSEMKKKDYVASGQGSIAQDIFVENFVPNRTAQLSLAGFTKVKIRIPGDSLISVGKTINFNLFSLSNKESDKELDKYYSGKYLVTAVRHIIQSTGVFQTILEISRESPAESFNSVNTSSLNIKEASNE
jgi:hypothetical protein